MIHEEAITMTQHYTTPEEGMDADDFEPRTAGLPEDHREYTDKYFMRSREILEEEGIDPEVSVKVFARGEGDIPQQGLEEAYGIFEEYAEEFQDNDGDLYLTTRDRFETKEPLMVIEGSAQDVVELETMYLGVLSHHLTEANADGAPDPDTFRENVEAAVEQYDRAGVDGLYFGARHYHWSNDQELAGAALDGGLVQTSTDAGSSNIGEDGVGTTPHFLTLAITGAEGTSYTEEDGTRATAELFDEHMDEDISRTTLIDTFNQEIDDALDIAEYFDENTESDDWTATFRVDTCGENVAQGGEPFDPEAEPYETGTGVRTSGVKALRDALIEEGYGDNTRIVLSSGFGDVEKAAAFADAQQEYREETAERFGESFDLFHGIGAGSFDDGVHTTADIYEVDGEAFAKTGREQDPAEIERFIDEHMVQVI